LIAASSRNVLPGGAYGATGPASAAGLCLNSTKESSAASRAVRPGPRLCLLWCESCRNGRLHSTISHRPQN